MENPWIITNKTHRWVHWKDNIPIETTKFAMCGLHFFVHVVEGKNVLRWTTRNVTPWFPWTHQTLKNHRKHLNNFFHLLCSIDFEIPITSCIFMFIIIAFKKSFKNDGHLSLNFLVKNTNLKHDMKIFFGIFFSR
jgi:hypothetical protein